MAVYYLDASALVKLYVREAGSLRLKQIYDAPENEIVFVAVGLVEAASALARRRRMGQMSETVQRALYAGLLRDAKQRFTLYPPNDIVLLRAAELTQRYPLRGYDAVHLAAALELQRLLTLNHLSPVVMLSADEKLNAAARAEALRVETPQ